MDYFIQVKQWIRFATVVLAVLLCVIAGTIVAQSQFYTSWLSEHVVAPTQVQEIIIERPAFSTIKLDRVAEDSWRISDPCSLPANNQRVAPLLGLAQPGSQHLPADEVDLDAAGLNAPVASISFDGQAVDIGATDLSGERRYALRDQAVEFIPSWIAPLIDGGLSALASLNVFNNPIERIEIVESAGNPMFMSLAPTQWQSLAAQQIVKWPMEESPNELLGQTTLTITQSNLQRTLNVLIYDTYASLVFAAEHCAYIIPISDVPIDDNL